MAITILAKNSKVIFFIVIFVLVMIMYSFMGGTFSTIEGNQYTVDFRENNGEWRGDYNQFNRIANMAKTNERKAKREAKREARRQQEGSNNPERQVNK